MEVAALEVLLLDTQEKEGEDNKLVHVCEDGRKASPWSGLRGVFAAAMGTMKSVAGESLVTAQFKAVDAADQPTIVGFVDLNEVLFVMVFVACALPQKIVEYYTRSSCELIVSLLGYPSQKLSDWKEVRGEQCIETKVTRICRGIFSCIRRDLQWETHLHLAFDGSVPAVTYPLETMARLSAFQVIEPLGGVYEIEGYTLFYRRMLVVAKTTPEHLKLLNQWMLHDDFDTEAEEGDRSSISLFKWFDAHYTLYGPFPADLSLVRIRHHDVLVFYLIRHLDSTVTESFRSDPSAVISTEDLEELLNFADTRLQRHYDTFLQRRWRDLASSTPIWYCVVLDKLRHTLHGFRPIELFAGREQSASHQIDPHVWQPMLEMLASVPSISFQRKRIFPHAASNDSSGDKRTAVPVRKRWIPPVRLDFDNHDSLLLRPVRPEDDAGADISSEDAQIFPPIPHELENQAIDSLRMYPGGELQQEAERLRLDDGRLVWVIANYYEVFDLYAVCDAAVPLERLEQEMDDLLKLDC